MNKRGGRRAERELQEKTVEECIGGKIKHVTDASLPAGVADNQPT
jgi:hypothetical protein